MPSLCPNLELKVLFVNHNPITEEMSPEEIAAERIQRQKRAKRKRIRRVFDRIFGFLFATFVMIGVACLALEYVIVKGPSPAMRDRFVLTMLETRRFGFIPNIFLNKAEVDEIKGLRGERVDIEFDSSLIQIPSQNPAEQAEQGEQPESSEGDLYGYVDEDGDGYILVDVKGKGFNGKMIIVLDPKRVYVGKGGEGQTINLIASRTGAIGGINGGSFFDPDGSGSGREPDGLTMIQGNLDHIGSGGYEAFVGFDAEGIMHVGYFNFADVMEAGIVNGVTFAPGPLLIVNGIPQDTSFMNSGINPRTCIGQRADGAVLMLVIDGRQLSSAGATYADCVEVMQQFGAVNAMNLDGGSSTVMILNGELMNSPSSLSGYSRGLPNAFLFK